MRRRLAPARSADSPSSWSDARPVLAADAYSLLPTLAPRSFDHAILDPAYAAHVHDEDSLARRADGVESKPIPFPAITPEQVRIVAREHARIVRGWILIFCDLESVGLWRAELDLAGAHRRNTLVWVKTNAAPHFHGDGPSPPAEAIVTAWNGPLPSVWNAGGSPGLYVYPSPRGERRRHATEKPLPLLLQLVLDFTMPGESVLDVFAGSGPTIAACRRLGRVGRGCDLDPHWAAYSCERASRIVPIEPPAPTGEGRVYVGRPLKARTLPADPESVPEPSAEEAPEASESGRSADVSPRGDTGIGDRDVKPGNVLLSPSFEVEKSEHPPENGSDPAEMEDGSPSPPARVIIVEKPPFRLPTMAEIAAARGSTGLKVVSTFTGAGGSCLGFQMAGYEPVYAVEFVEAARETYRANHRGVYVDERDVRQIRAEEILERIGLRRGELHVLEGSPPCASFSTAGKRTKKWGQTSSYSETRQRSDDLFEEFIRLIDGIRPMVFVAENVSGLVKGPAYGYFKLVIERMAALGYRVRAKLLDAQWLGVPQDRRRLILIGVREDLGIDPSYPDPLPYNYTMREALPWLDSVVWDNSGVIRNKEVLDRPAPTITNAMVESGGQNKPLAPYHFHVAGPAPEEESGDWPDDAVHPLREGAKEGPPPRVPFAGRTRLVHRDGFSAGEVVELDRPAPTVMAAGIAGSHRSQVLIESIAREAELNREEVDAETAGRSGLSMDGTAIGREWDRTRVGGISSRYFMLWRPDPDRPSPTITAEGGRRGVAGVTHPLERRKFTIRELKRLCAFPDDFVMTGKYDQKWERCGRSVPPRMMFHVARTIRDRVFGPLGMLRDGWTEAP